MKKIAFIIVRYGENINGGAEVHCQMLAERLLPYYEVEVLTTTIRAFNHPDQDYTEGVSSWNGVTIRRFKPQPIDQEQFRPFRKKYKTARRIRQYLKKLNLLRAASFLHPEWKSGIENERPFYESTATHAPGLLRYIESHKAEYAAFIFANFYTPQAVLGSVVAPEKSLLIPMAHPDKPLYYCINAPMFTRVRHIAFNTEAERQLCRSVFGRFLAPNSIVGCGIEMAPEAEWSGVKAKYGGDAKLVLVGGFENEIRKFDSPDILFTGYVSDEEKTAIVRHATVMVNPSPMESLSLLMLEGMQSRIPLLVNGRSKVMKDHCRLSGAGLWYNNGRDFRKKLHRLLSDPELRRTMSEKGPAYVREHYDWEIIIPKLRTLIESI